MIDNIYTTQDKLSPALILKRWKLRQKVRIMNTANSTADFVRSNAGILGTALGLGIVIAASRALTKRALFAKRRNKILYDHDS